LDVLADAADARFGAAYDRENCLTSYKAESEVSRKDFERPPPMPLRKDRAAGGIVF
jgi:hypothetical protein